MWLCVDRIEDDTVVLLDDTEKAWFLSIAAYTAMVGRVPNESDVLSAELDGSRIISAAYDGEETAARKATARNRLNRLFGRS